MITDTFVNFLQVHFDILVHIIQYTNTNFNVTFDKLITNILIVFVQFNDLS